VYEPAPDIPYIPAHRPIVPLERLGAIVEVILCSGFPSQLLLVLAMRGFGMPVQTSDGHLFPPFVFTLALADALLVIALVLYLLRAHREPARQVLLGERSIIREALVGVALLPAIFMFVILILGLVFKFAPHLHNVPNNPLEDMLRNQRDALIFAAVVMIAGGVREEIQRGFILHRFEQYLGGGAWGIAIYSVIFGLGHFEQGFDAMIITALLGAIWGLVYLTRRSIVAPMVSHAAFNLAQLIKYLVFLK
jgi:CAAX protease family protein